MVRNLQDGMVHVIVNEPKIWVVYKDRIHSAVMGDTVEPGEFSDLHEVEGDENLLNAATYAWDGQESFSIPYSELIERSGGWGVETYE